MTIRNASISVVTAILITACTHNNGDIGPIFGQWQLTAVETAGTALPVTLPEGNIYWGFQSSTIHMSWITPDHGQDNRFGNFRLDDDTLFLDFPDEGYQFAPLLGLPDQCAMQVIRLTSKQLILMYQPTDDGSVTYTFRKW